MRASNARAIEKGVRLEDVEVHMRKFSLTLATGLLALGIATSAHALPISAPAGLRAAIEEASTTQKV